MNPTKYDQSSMVWAVPIKAGVSYKVVADSLIDSGACPMGVFRFPHAQSGARLPYVVSTTPGNDMELRANDTVYALGSKTWAAQRGLFTGEVPPPPPPPTPSSTKAQNGAFPRGFGDLDDSEEEKSSKNEAMPRPPTQPMPPTPPDFERDKRTQSFEDDSASPGGVNPNVWMEMVKETHPKPPLERQPDSPTMKGLHLSL
eukprot:CAMPEP_0114329066 /NCGR_PEP_ID=MMETSP0101-20121206/827_1 /TAXON_ID=38822 ORGANISM="Pteridomonas danica, Strain PT" /NCGR_SAMPLE_ID=MMETSP0101 /ASSEMBLY_ACC=CAM_ASM_000211 /LENGTH=199 /DNA_ID=CAMNT_0001458601 /DNA_START=1 /DNA_END=600 /DNA_ORIENTATION=-